VAGKTAIGPKTMSLFPCSGVVPRRDLPLASRTEPRLHRIGSLYLSSRKRGRQKKRFNQKHCRVNTKKAIHAIYP
jgi:hypothetical protein